jgi:type I restriction-modification system DNA methylase subunit
MNTSKQIMTQNLKNLIDNIANILRDNEYITGDKCLRTTTYLLVYKLIEKHLNEFDIYNKNLYDLRAFRTDKNQEDLIFKCLKFSELYKILKDEKMYNKNESIIKYNDKNYELSEIINKIWKFILSYNPNTKNIYVIGGSFNIKNSSTFYKIICKIEEFNFDEIDEDILGYLYEDLLQHIMVGKVLGQFFTPYNIKKLMIDIIKPQLKDNGQIETIFDPAMGTGGFLITALKDIKEQSIKNKIDIDWDFIINHGIGGNEVEIDTFTLANANLFISSGHIYKNIFNKDSIKNMIQNKYDIIMANPPFGMSGIDYSIINSQLKTDYLPIETKNGICLFIQLIIHILNKNGRCGVIVPSGGQELFGKRNDFKNIRKYLLKSCDLQSIYYLDSSFKNTSIKTCILYFVKKHEYKDIIINYDDFENYYNGTNERIKKKPTLKFKNDFSTKTVKFYDYNYDRCDKKLLVEVSIKEIEENDFSLNYKIYEREVENVSTNSNIDFMKIEDIFDFEKGKIQSSKVIVDENSDIIFINLSKNKDFKSIKIDASYNDEGLFISNTSPCGLIQYYKGKYNFSNLLYKLILKSNLNINYKYIYYYLKNIENILETEYYKGTANKSLNQELFNKLKIPVPSLEVQNKVVKHLDELYENTITINDKKIENLKNLNKNFVDFNSKSLINDTLINPKKLGDICEIDFGTRIVKSNNTEGEYDVYGSGNATFTTNTYNRKNFNILIGRFAVSETCVRLLNKKLYLNDSGLTIKPKNNNLLHKFLGYYIINNQHLIYNSCRGTAQKNLDVNDFKLIKIPIPSLEIQNKIVEYCDANTKLIEDLQKQNDECKSMSKMYFDKITQEATNEDDDDVELPEVSSDEEVN